MNLKDSALAHLVNILNNNLNFRAKINVQSSKNMLICHVTLNYVKFHFQLTFAAAGNSIDHRKCALLMLILYVAQIGLNTV